MSRMSDVDRVLGIMRDLYSVGHSPVTEVWVIMHPVEGVMRLDSGKFAWHEKRWAKSAFKNHMLGSNRHPVHVRAYEELLEEVEFVNLLAQQRREDE